MRRLRKTLTYLLTYTYRGPTLANWAYYVRPFFLCTNSDARTPLLLAASRTYCPLQQIKVTLLICWRSFASVVSSAQRYSAWQLNSTDERVSVGRFTVAGLLRVVDEWPVVYRQLAVYRHLRGASQSG